MVRDFTQRFLPVWQSAVSLPVHEADALASVRETEAQLEHAHEIRLGSNRVVSRRAYSQNCDVSHLWHVTCGFVFAWRCQMPTKVGEPSDVEGKIRGAFRQVLGLAAINIAVTINGGCVSLCGEVCTPEQRARAEALARATAGVSSVKNYLSINLFQ